MQWSRLPRAQLAKVKRAGFILLVFGSCFRDGLMLREEMRMVQGTLVPALHLAPAVISNDW